MDEPVELCSSKWSSEGEGKFYVEAFEKCKATTSGPFHGGVLQLEAEDFDCPTIQQNGGTKLIRLTSAEIAYGP